MAQDIVVFLNSGKESHRTTARPVTGLLRGEERRDRDRSLGREKEEKETGWARLVFYKTT